MSQGIIYLIINKNNGHKYIGQSTQPLNKIWQNHIREADRMSPKLIHRAFRKFGMDKFSIKVIDECDESLLTEREHYWIEKYKSYENGYNDVIVKEEKQDLIIPEQKPVIKKPTWNQIKPEHRGNGKHFGLRVLGINIETGEEKIWENARDAAYEVAGDRRKNSNILFSARNGYKCYGYRWRILDNKTKKKSIVGVHKRTWERLCFESIAEATRQLGNGCKGAGLVKSLKNPHKYSWKGYYWFYT